MSVKYCAHCGTKNEANGHFCTNCGSPISLTGIKKTEGKNSGNKIRIHEIDNDDEPTLENKNYPTKLKAEVIIGRKVKIDEVISSDLKGEFRSNKNRQKSKLPDGKDIFKELEQEMASKVIDIEETND